MSSQDALSPEDRATSDRLLSEIVGNPCLDEPRLVYADWLTERGDPRGSFIVDQCRLAQLDETDPEWCVLYARSERTLFQHRARWTQAARELLQIPALDDEDVEYWEMADPFVFRRGFIEQINRSIKEPEHLETLARMTPLRCVGLAPGRKVREVAAVHARLGLPGLQLRMYDGGFPEGLFDEGLQGGVDFDEDEEDEESVAQDEDDAQSLPDGLHPDEVLDAIDLLELVDLTKVEDLTVYGYFQPSQIQSLAQLLERAPLRSLVLTSCGITSGAAAKLAGRFLEKLETLDLSQNDVGVQGLRKLLQGRSKGPITLRLGANQRLRKHGHLVADGPLLALDMSDLASDELIEKLGQKDTSHGLRRLDLGPLTDTQLQALAKVLFGRLTRLNISGYGGQPPTEGLAALCEAPQFGTLVELNLYGTDIRDDGVAALVRSPHLTRLTHLDLSSCQITERGAIALASWPGLANLVELKLSNNPLGSKGLEALMKSPLDPVRLELDSPRSNRMRHALYERFGEAIVHW